MYRSILRCLAIFLAASSLCAFAQDDKASAAPDRFFRLVYVVQEVNEDGKVFNARTYSTDIGTGAVASIRTGDKIPIRTTDDKQAIQYQYIDVGVDIDSKVAQEINGKISLGVKAQISSPAPVKDSGLGPVIRQNSWDGRVLVPIGKPTIIFSSDNVQDKGKMQVELTATRLE